MHATSQVEQKEQVSAPTCGCSVSAQASVTGAKSPDFGFTFHDGVVWDPWRRQYVMWFQKLYGSKRGLVFLVTSVDGRLWSTPEVTVGLCQNSRCKHRDAGSFFIDPFATTKVLSCSGRGFSFCVVSSCSACLG